MKSQYRNAGIPDDVISQGETAIQNYAFENGITLPDFTSQDEEPLFEMNSNAQDTGVQAQSAQANQSDGSTKRLKYNA
jgi:hypothetical protein